MIFGCNNIIEFFKVKNFKIILTILGKGLQAFLFVVKAIGCDKGYLNSTNADIFQTRKN